MLRRRIAPRRRCPRPLRLAGLLLVSVMVLLQAAALLRPPGARAELAVPFVVVFESSSGSSWLLQLLSSHPAACVVGFEPIDNISMTSASDHASRIRWLGQLWAPRTESEAGWAAWRRGLEEASVFGQLPAIRQSLQRCDRRRSRAFGLKARLSRLLTDTVAVPSLAQLMRARGARVLRLSRRNRIKQALAEYNRLHAGRGQFVASGAAAGSSAGGRPAVDANANATGARPSAAAGVEVDLERFRAALRAVERSRRLTARVLSELGDVETLSLGEPRTCPSLTYVRSSGDRQRVRL